MAEHWEIYADWNPWHGCTKISPGCKYCYVYRQDEMYGSEHSSSECRKTAAYNLPIKRKRDKSWKIKTQALDLAIQVFMEFEAPEYPTEGVEEFKHALKNPEYIDNLRYYVYFDKGKVVGMLATRNNGSHIALFFVDKNHQGKGIGRRLFEQAFADCKTEEMTVYSAPYAVNIYKSLGFKATDVEQMENGIRFTPMKIKKYGEET